MGIIALFVFISGIVLSIVVIGSALANQRKLIKDGKGISWAKFLTIAFVLTIAFGLYGVSILPEDLSGEFDLWMSSTFLISLAPGLGFISANIISSK